MQQISVIFRFLFLAMNLRLSALFFLFLTGIASSQAQKENEDLFKRFVPIDELENPANSEKLILKTDTLVRNDRSFGNVTNRAIYRDDFIYEKYLQLAFPRAHIFSEKNSSIPVIQWKEDLYVYLDKDLPFRFRKRLKSHLKETYREVPNLKIRFTGNQGKSLIAIVHTTDSVYEMEPGTKSYKSYLKQFPDGLPFDHVKSIQTTNYDGSRNTSLFKINYDAIASEDLALQKISQLFYLTLTGFRPSRSGNVSSFTTFGYELQDEINSMDMELLKMHYQVLWEVGPTYADFIRLTRPDYE